MLLAMFYSSLHFAISTSSYNNINVKSKQVKCLEAVYNGRDLVAVLPTGYGKSMIFHLLPALLYDKGRSEARNSAILRPIVIVVSPLNALTKDQIRRISQGKLKAAALNIKKKQNSADLELDVGETSFSHLKEGDYDIVFTHPKASPSCKKGMNLFQSATYRKGVRALVVDEAHCILEWYVFKPRTLKVGKHS